MVSVHPVEPPLRGGKQETSSAIDIRFQLVVETFGLPETGAPEECVHRAQPREYVVQQRPDDSAVVELPPAAHEDGIGERPAVEVALVPCLLDERLRPFQRDRQIGYCEGFGKCPRQEHDVGSDVSRVRRRDQREQLAGAYVPGP